MRKSTSEFLRRFEHYECWNFCGGWMLDEKIKNCEAIGHRRLLIGMPIHKNQKL